jgi:hypothetical protein|tara:strand:- start:206 stop:2644 length:2439 start_codon:yes stop_codon:yes gene_type:complete
MTNINFVTSFNESLFVDTSYKFLESVLDKWEPNINLTCYTHDLDLKNYVVPDVKQIDFKSLHDVPDYNTFQKTFTKHNGTEGKTVDYNWKLDALRWSHKVFALTESAFNLVAEHDMLPATTSLGWLIWIDADSYTLKRMTTKDVLALLPEGADVVCLERSDQEYHEGAFIAFNLKSKATQDLLGDLRGAYISGEVFNYREWHDSFIFTRLLTIYKAHGLKVLNLGMNADTKNFSAFEQSPLSSMFLHFQGADASSLKNIRDEKGERFISLSEDTTHDILPSRYTLLSDVMKHYKPEKTILETGTWNGGRAIQMAMTMFEHSDTVHYIGYDLFEEATPETDEEEFNVKAHNKMSAVETRLTDFANIMLKRKSKYFTFELFKGNTRNTLTKKDADFVLLGGGNSFETVQNEYKKLKHNKVIVFDNYYMQDSSERNVIEKYQGVNKVYESIQETKVKEGKEDEEGWTSFDDEDTGIRKLILPSSDDVRGGGIAHLSLILNDPELPQVPKKFRQVPIIVNPRDCVSKDYIRDNIKSNLKMIEHNRFMHRISPHNKTALIVSGGPYLDIKELKDTIKDNPGCKVVCVKHSYNKLLTNGIKPWACVLLDPRPITGTSTHGIVRKDLFKDVDPSTKFFVASMTDPSVTEHLIEKKADIYGWHAFTESLREEDERGVQIVNNQVHLVGELGIPQGSTLITGGTCAAMRAIGIMNTMGFREMHLFGFDCSMEEPTEEQMKETTGAEDEEPKPKYMKVTVNDKDFWTTGELLAMAQDCERSFRDENSSINFTYHGEGTMVAELWKIIESERPLPTFKEVFDD